MTLFDRYIFVDWSAKNGPTAPGPCADAVWAGELDRGSRRTHAPDRLGASYFRTRHAAVEWLEARLLRAVAAGQRTLVGFDFPFGYPTGFGRAIGADPAIQPWRHVWDRFATEYKDGPANHNNRFTVAAALNGRCRSSGSGPFWCCPVAVADRLLTVKRGGVSFPFTTDSGVALAEHRACDLRVRASGRRIHTVWQLLGTGSVGGQALAGIPYVHRLRRLDQLAGVSRVWPFETGFTESPVPRKGPAVVYVEIWPTLADAFARPRDGLRDRSQVLAMLRWISGLDARSELASLFGPPAGLPLVEMAASIAEEGWMLGVR